MQSRICEVGQCNFFNEVVPENHQHHIFNSNSTVTFIKPIEDDPINHPKHYTSHPSGVECIEVTRHFYFNVGNAIKYLWRHLDKGDPIENLEKAKWYIEDEIQRLKSERTTT